MTILLSELQSLLKEIELKEQLIANETYIAINTTWDKNLLGLSNEYKVFNDNEDNTILAFSTLKQQTKLNE